MSHPVRRLDAMTLHQEARRYRSRLLAYLIRRSIRAVAAIGRKPPARAMRPALAR